jgi:hypothetical protein
VVVRERELTVGGVHGGHGRGSGRGGGGVVRGEEGSEESYGGGRPECGTWGCREAGGSADRVATTASGGERRLGQMTPVWHDGERPARGRGRRSEAGEDAWKGSERRGGGGSAAHGRDSGGGAAQRRNRGGRAGGGRRGLNCNIPKTQGLHCNAQVTFKTELK